MMWHVPYDLDGDDRPLHLIHLKCDFLVKQQQRRQNIGL